MDLMQVNRPTVSLWILRIAEVDSAKRQSGRQPVRRHPGIQGQSMKRSKGSKSLTENVGGVAGPAKGRSSQASSSQGEDGQVPDLHGFRSDEQRVMDALEDDAVREVLRANRERDVANDSFARSASVVTDIVTITPNPAVDLSTVVNTVSPTLKLRGISQRRDPGGGGVNVARVIKRLGGEACAIYPVGGAIGTLLRELLDSEGIASQTFAIEGETREDFFVSETSTGHHYRFILPGPCLQEGEWQECLKLVAAIEPFPRFVVASGSLPAGTPDDFYARVARIAKQRGARMILDTSGPALAAAVDEGVDLIKPNLREMRELSGTDPSDAREWEEAAKAVVRAKRVSVVALTMGHLGAALVTQDRILRAKPLAIAPRSAVGAGDSFLAALVWKLAMGADLIDCFRLAVAAGAAALLNPGTELCHPHDVKRLAAEAVVEGV